MDAGKRRPDGFRLCWQEKKSRTPPRTRTRQGPHSAAFPHQDLPNHNQPKAMARVLWARPRAPRPGRPRAKVDRAAPRARGPGSPPAQPCAPRAASPARAAGGAPTPSARRGGAAARPAPLAPSRSDARAPPRPELGRPLLTRLLLPAHSAAGLGSALAPSS
jgi:hypothetical protein